MARCFFFILTILLLASCKNNNKAIHEDIINLYPDKELIKKKYYKYSLQDPFSPNDTLYTPIEPSSKNPKMAKTLIKATNPYDLQYFNKFLTNEMNGNYNDYIIQNNTILYRYYFKHYENKDKKRITSKEDIENYLSENSINFDFIKSKDGNLYFYLLKRKEQLPSSYCIIKLHNDNLETSIIYNAKDTIRSLSLDALRPFLGSEIENK